MIDMDFAKGTLWATSTNVMLGICKYVFGFRIELIQASDIYIEVWETILLAILNATVTVVTAFYVSRWLTKRDLERKNKQSK
jgi:ABC-type phosphate/phosphonate transport system permease subunit